MTAETPRWKRVFLIAGWIWVIFPVGLWKLWKDPVLTVTEKWRVFIYLFVMPLLAYFAISLSAMNAQLNKLLP